MTEVTNSETQQPQQAPTGIQVGDMQAVVTLLILHVQEAPLEQTNYLK